MSTSLLLGSLATLECIREKGKGKEGTNDTRNTAVIDIHQIAVEIHVLLSTNLDCCVCCFVGQRARWEGHFGEESEWGEVDGGVRFCSEVLLSGKLYFLYIWVGRLFPEWS